MALLSTPRYRQFQPPVIAPGLIDPNAEDDEFLGAPPVPPPGPNAQPAVLPMRAAATPAPPPQQLTNAQAGVSSMPLAPLNGGGPRQPPPNPYRAPAASTNPAPVPQGPPPNPNAAPVLGALDNQVATSDSDANISPQAPAADARAPIADQLADKRQELVAHDQGLKSNIMQRIALAALAATRFAPMAPFLVHPKASLERANITNQIGDLEGAQADQFQQARIEAEKQHGDYWANRSLQERNRFKIDPKTGTMYDTQTGQIAQQPKSLQDKIAEYTTAGFSPEDSRMLATGQKITPMTKIPDQLADNLGLPHGFEMPTDHIATIIGAANRPVANTTEAQLALDAQNPDQTISGPAKAALSALQKGRQDLKMTARGGAGGAGAGMPAPPTSEATLDAMRHPPGLGQRNEAYLQSLPPQDQPVVKALAEYRMQFPSSYALTKSYWQKMMSKVAAYDPVFDATQYHARQRLRGDFVAGKAAQNIRSLNTLAGHLGSLEEAGQALQNGDNQTINKIVNAMSNEFGNPSITNFDLAKNAVSTELSSALKGQATEGDIKAWRDQISRAQSPDQLKAAVSTPLHLMYTRLEALHDQYQGTMGRVDVPIIYPHAQSVFTSHGIGSPGAGSVRPGASASGMDLSRFEAK